MMATLNSLEQEFDHFLHAEGGGMNQINLRLTAIESQITEVLAWRDSMSKHITTAITAPLAGTTQYGSISVTATAVDTLGHGIVKVDFYIDDVFFATDAVSPYTQTLDTKQYSNASHTIKVLTYCNNAAVGWGSNTITITINNVIPSGGTTVGGGTASYGDVVSVGIQGPTPGSSVPMSFQISVGVVCSAGHPISSVTCGGVAGSHLETGFRWFVQASFDGTSQSEKTFTIIATCTNGTIGTATATYRNLNYIGQPPGGWI